MHQNFHMQTLFDDRELASVQYPHRLTLLQNNNIFCFKKRGRNGYE
jgi:hypothetical protein